MSTARPGDRSPPIHAMKAREVAGAVLGGGLTARGVAAAMTARIARLDPVLNAFVHHVPEQVLAEADAVDARIAAGERPPLAGVPFTVKDNLWLGGRPATFGSRLFADFVAPRDSWCVARLRELGAVPLGVTACSEFACKGVTNTPLHGRTLNPWDTTRTPGGSSGGAVAAVAAGLGPLALATDAGGSTRRPAAHTGLVGMKPTLGYVPNPWGFEDPNHLLSVIGQVARDVEDCALMLDALAGFDGRDPLSQPIFATARVGDALKAQRPAWRVAVAADLGCGFAIDADVHAAFDAAIGRLTDAGWLIVQAHPAWPAGGGEYPLLALQQAELAALFGEAWRSDPSRFDPDIAAQIGLGTAVDGVRIAQVLMLRDRLSAAYAAFFDRFDLLITLTAPVEPWPVEQLGPPEIGGRPAGPRGHAGFTPLFNYCGAPAVSIPFGFGRNGLPLGLQIAGPRHSDARVLAAAWQAERVFGLDMRSPMLRDD